jgi:cysteine-rich repeat protein
VTRITHHEIKTMKTYTKRSLIALIAAAMFAIPTFAAGEPENVTGLAATPVDATSVGLTWNSAKDAEGGLVNHYRIYYGATSVQTAGEGDYASETDTSNNNTNYVVTGLAPNTTYYFSVTAIDSKSVESGAYSLEASATTPANGGEEADITSPAVVDVEAVDKTHVKVVFSEAVVLPTLLPEAAFSIEEQINPANTLEVTSAVADEKDATGVTVLLGTAEQALNVNYIVTAGVAITDLAGNPIISGSADSGLFIGTDVVAESGEGEEAPEEGLGEAAPEETVCGNGTVEEGEACDDGNIKSNDGCSDVCVVDQDITPPEDITSLVLSFKKDLEKFIIVMNWTASINTAKDLVDQILYQSMDLGGTYDSGKSLGADATNYELPDMEGGKEYTFKISTKDAAGNESVGVVKSIRLPQTGVGIGLLLLGSAGVAGRLLRRKQK